MLYLFDIKNQNLFHYQQHDTDIAKKTSAEFLMALMDWSSAIEKAWLRKETGTLKGISRFLQNKINGHKNQLTLSLNADQDLPDTKQFATELVLCKRLHKKIDGFLAVLEH